MPCTLCILCEDHRNKSIPDDGVVRKPSVFMLEGLSGSSFYGLKDKGPWCFPKSHRLVSDKAEGTAHESLFFFFQELSPKTGASLMEPRLKFWKVPRARKMWFPGEAWTPASFFGGVLHPVAYRILVLSPGIKPMPFLQWNRRVLATGQPGKALSTHASLHTRGIWQGPLTTWKHEGQH